MKPLARRAVSSLVCAAIMMAQWPASAWAAAGDVEPSPADAMKMFRELGVYKDDADPLKTYLGNEGKLTPIGRTLYLSLKNRYNPAEEVEAMKPALARLRAVGVYTPARQDGAARAMRNFEAKFGEIANIPAGGIEESFRAGALREAAMTGAAVTDPPKPTDYLQVTIADGFEFWDAAGLAFRMNKNQVTTYNRDLQKTQRQMNLNLPPRAAPIPETGRYNYEMFQYSYWRIKNQEQDYIDGARIDRMIGMAELLGKQYSVDAWFLDKSLEADLIRLAKDKTYEGRDGKDVSVFDIVDAKFKQRRAYIVGAQSAVLRYEKDMNAFKASSTVRLSQRRAFCSSSAIVATCASVIVFEALKAFMSFS